MEKRRLIFNDGTTLESAEAGYADGSLWLYITGIEMQEAAGIVFNPEKTSKIVFAYGEMEDTYEGFTFCKILRTDDDGEISACMMRR